MGSFINNDSSRCAMSGENIFDQTFGYNLNIIRGSCYCLYPLGDIINIYKDVLIYKGLGNGPMKSMSNTSNNSISKIWVMPFLASWKCFLSFGIYQRF